MEYSRVEDCELAAAAQQEDRNAFKELVLRYQQKLYRYVYRFARDPDDAEDMLQDAFLRIFDKLHLYDSSRPFGPWAYRVTANICRDRLRRRPPRTLSLNRAAYRNDDGNGAELQDNLADSSFAPDTPALCTELQTILEQAVAALPVKQRETFLLYHDAKLSQQEIASIQRIPVGTVKSRIHHATKSVYARLEKEGQL